MNRLSRARALGRRGLAPLVCVFASGCAKPPLDGPPEIRLGRSECAECNMLISEDRCSSALLIEDRGRREHLLYDDVGCMLDDERDGLGERTVITRYVHDHGTRAWLDASAAVFVLTDPKEVMTPMGSGILAFASHEDARRAVDEHGGEAMNYAALIEARRAWMEARYGTPRPLAGDGG